MTEPSKEALQWARAVYIAMGCGDYRRAWKILDDFTIRARDRCELIALRIRDKHRARDVAAQAAGDIETSARELSKAQAADEVAQAIRERAKP